MTGEQRLSAWQCRECGHWNHPDDESNVCARFPECRGLVAHRPSGGVPGTRSMPRAKLTKLKRALKRQVVLIDGIPKRLYSDDMVEYIAELADRHYDIASGVMQ